MTSIFIISTPLDNETNGVIKWLHELSEVDVTRMNGIHKNADISVDMSNQNPIKISDKNLNDFDSIWFRKFPNYEVDLTLASQNKQIVRDNLLKQNTAIYDLISFPVKSNVLGSRRTVDNDKLRNLLVARNVGFKIPKTIITGNKSELLEFYDANQQEIIAKPISNLGFLSFDGNNYGAFTEKISAVVLDRLPGIFYPTLFQEKLNRKYEIRVFYLKGKLYASAIFNNNKNSVDVRKSGLNTINRIVPILLAKKVSKKVIDFMVAAELNIGSIDLLVTTNNQTYFLEVNPFGQFKQYSDQCNYHLEREVAKELLKNEG